MELKVKHDEKSIHYTCFQGKEGRGNKEYDNNTYRQRGASKFQFSYMYLYFYEIIDYFL